MRIGKATSSSRYDTLEGPGLTLSCRYYFHLGKEASVVVRSLQGAASINQGISDVQYGGL